MSERPIRTVREEDARPEPPATVREWVEHSDLNVQGFMRWSVPRQFSMLARYKQTPTDVTDKEILNKHPYVKFWEEASPYILEHNSSYQSKPHILT